MKSLVELWGLPPNCRVNWHIENWEMRQNSTCRTQNGVSESMPQTITTQPFCSIQFETFFLLVKLNFTADSDRSYSTHSQDKYDYKMTHRTNIAQNAPLMETVEYGREPYDKAGFTKTRRPNGPHSRNMERHSSSLNMPSAWAPILWKEEGCKSIVCDMGVSQIQKSE